METSGTGIDSRVGATKYQNVTGEKRLRTTGNATTATSGNYGEWDGK
jgi:hypothetical protein